MSVISVRVKKLRYLKLKVKAIWSSTSVLKPGVTECTGHYSQTAARKAGFQERARLTYRDFRFDGRAVFADIEPPHLHVILYEREF